MKTLLLVAVISAATATGALAQERGNADYSGSVPWQFRSPEERVARLATAQSVLVNRAGFQSGFGSGGGGFGGPGGQATAVNNYFQVSNSVSCSASAVGAVVSCTGGSTSVSGVTQDTNNSNATARTEITGNTVNNTGNTVQNGDVLNGPN